MSDRRALPAGPRVAFVRRCSMCIDDGPWHDGLLVNLNTTGAYIASDPIPAPGAQISLRFHLPGSTRQMELVGRVAWVSHRQTHPVHSLPPGCGIEFRAMSDELRGRIEAALAARSGA